MAVTKLGNLASCMVRSRYESAAHYPGVGINKLVAYKALEHCVPAPAILWQGEPSIGAWLDEAPSSFVLKNSRGWSSNNVYCLTRRGAGFHDSIRRRSFSSGDIQSTVTARTERDGEWFAEEFIGSAPAIPLDYKLFVVDGETVLIFVIDRNPGGGESIYNSTLQRVPPESIFTEDVLEVDELPADFHPDPDAIERLKAAARRCASTLRAPMVRVDLFLREPTRPVLGEITFSCGLLFYSQVREPWSSRLTPENYDRSDESWLERHARALCRGLQDEVEDDSPKSYQQFLKVNGLSPAEVSYRRFKAAAGGDACSA